MFGTHRIFRSALCATIVCAALATTATGAVLAAADPLAQERYYASHATPSSAAALAQEQYYSSYGEPEPLTSLQQPEAPSGETPSLPIALSLGGALVIVAASATQLHRLHTRRRRATA